MVLRDRLDRPLQHLRISVTDACNFRCPYCMPADAFGPGPRFLRGNELLSFEEILRLARLFVGLGVRKIKLTGGEPLLRPRLAELVRELSRIDGLKDLALVTNGVLLAGLAAPLRRAGLRRVTVSLDALRDDVFASLCGRGHALKEVLRGIDAAAAAGLGPLKLNAVIMRGINEDQVLDLVAFARARGGAIRFIEYMDVGNANGWKREQVVPGQELRERIGAAWPLETLAPEPYGEAAVRYRFRDGRGEVGFISSVTEPFCRGCTRARLSADGQLYTCLFASQGGDLRTLVRGGVPDSEIAAAIRESWLARDDRASEVRGECGRVPHSTGEKVEMHVVGG